MTDDFSEEERAVLSKTIVEQSVRLGWALPSLDELGALCKQHGGQRADFRCFLTGYFFGARKAAEESIRLVSQ